MKKSKSKYLLVNEDHTYLGFFELSPQEVRLLNLDNEEFFDPEKGE